jgi:hypothetical protein
MTGLLKIGVSLCTGILSYAACEVIDNFAEDKTNNNILKICAIQPISVIGFVVFKKI